MDLAKISTPKCGSIRDPLVLHLTYSQILKEHYEIRYDLKNAVDIRVYHILEEEEY
jgi:hypothetical protein